MKTLNVAVIGAGMAGRSHANGFRQAPTVFGPDLPPVHTAVIADANLALAQDTARRYGYERAVGRWQDVRDDPTVDVVSVVVGNSLHREVVEGLLEAGKHVLCEKPLAGPLADAEAMVEAAAKHDGLVTGVGYSYRRAPAFAALAREVAAGNLGDVSYLQGRYWCDYSCSPDVPWTWRYTGGPGTGAIADLGAHTIDLAELLLGRAEVVSGAQLQTAITERRVPLGATVGHQAGELSDELRPVDNEDVATFTVRFAGGAIGSFSFSRIAAGYANGQQIEISGTRGRALLDYERPAEFQLDGRAVLAGPGFPHFSGSLPTDAGGLSYGYSDLFVWQARSFLEQVAGITEKITDGLPTCASFADGLHTMKVIDAVRRSALAGGSSEVV